MSEPLLKFASDVQVKDGVITAVLSTESVDRDGDIVRADGWDLANFSKAPRLMSCHDYGSLLKQIGEWRNVHVDPQRKALVGEPHYYTNAGNPEADWAYHLASIGQATYSVGFNPAESEPRKAGGRVYTSQELLECSHVPIPANAEALQLMAKAFRLRHQGTRQPGRIVQKWDSNTMGDDDGYGYGQPDVHCIVPGCDDACQLYAPCCAEHLKVLMNAPAEPPGGEADEDIESMMRSLTRRFRFKAGRTMSAGNLGKLHTAMQALNDVHSAACTDDSCPLDDDGDETTPATARDKAAGESSGSSGGFAVSDSGTHGAFTGKHSHPHDAAGATASADEDGMHDHSHSHDDDGNHGHEHAGANFKTARDKAEQSTATQNDLPDSAFAVISAGGKKDADGMTTPRSLRHLPHHKADGSIDLPHLKTWKNALARVSQTDLSSADRATAEKHLDAHAKAEKIGDYADKAATQGLDPQALSEHLERELSALLEAF